MEQSATKSQCAYIYIIGEAQSALLIAEEATFAFARAHMAAIATAELESVLASVFGAGQLFAGPDTALGALIHEYASRSSLGVATEVESFSKAASHCLLILVFQGQDGSMRVRTAASIPLDAEKMPLRTEADAHQLVLENLPAFQQIFLEDPCNQQSRLVGLIKASALWHINKRLD